LLLSLFCGQPMGAATSGDDTAAREAALASLPEDVKGLPPLFVEIIVEVLLYKSQLGGLRNFTDFPTIDHKVKAEEFRHGYTDFEYVYLTVLGLARLQTHVEGSSADAMARSTRRTPGYSYWRSLAG